MAIVSSTDTDDIKINRDPLCNLPKDHGPCNKSVPRFYYDQETGRCTLFAYGGCQGNKNRFLTPWACRDTCGGINPDFNMDLYPSLNHSNVNESGEST